MKTDKSIVITGASSGIGRACALHLDKLGYQVFAGVRQTADAEALQADASPRLQSIYLDVTDEDSVASALKQVSQTLGAGGLAGLVNNAGVLVSGPLEFVPIAELRRQFEVNVIGQMMVTQAFLPLLRQGAGRIVNMGSMGGRLALPFAGPYAASKFALEALTDSLRVELQPWDIAVIIVEPGVVDTQVWDKPFAPSDEQLLEKLSPQAQSLYGAALSKVYKMTRRVTRLANPPERVAAVVGHALTSRHPQTRYLVGLDAKAADAVARLLPDRWRDRLMP
jgi:NAD(P)-dependent dehydrogenase (short-subunit alcohol dehydrogenase family)